MTPAPAIASASGVKICSPGAPDIHARQRIGVGYRVDAGWIVLHSNRAAVLSAAQIEKRDHVRRIKEHTKAAANHGVFVAWRLIGKAYAWTEAGPELFDKCWDVDPGNRDPIRRGGIEDVRS